MEYPVIPRPGTNPEKDAWIANFYTENHLAYEVFPQEVASPEQLRFIVFLEDEPYYYPCSDRTFHTIIDKKGGEFLVLSYMKIWERLEPLVRSVVDNTYKRRFLLTLLKIKFRHETASLVMLPSRLEKRLLQIFVRVSDIDRPLASVKEKQNGRIYDIIKSEAFNKAFNARKGLEIEDGTSLDEINFRINMLQLRRLLGLTSHSEIWTGTRNLKEKDLTAMMDCRLNGRGWQWFQDTLKDWSLAKTRHYLLWMGVSAGSILLDLAMIRILIRMGIKVILVVKKAFYYESVTMADVLEDPFLQEFLYDAEIITNPQITKNALIDRLKSDKMLFVISDGTQERFNPLLMSVTFARAFKEADAVVNRSDVDGPCLLKTRFSFTRDILVITNDRPGEIELRVKRRHPRVIRFSEADLRAKAEALIYHLKMEKQRGKTIMFYSAIVGSIPQELETAKKILKVFINYLRQKQEGVVVINPAEHFEPGMDADYIMYMWEILQRSGLIDIWRFQTVEDIEKAFELMGHKVPPEWVGKDATYSTGCTKEMQIALEVQREHPEMQIIGPPWEKFLRRKEYGVGKLYDRALGDV